jgi:hypothetical protein
MGVRVRYFQVMCEDMIAACRTYDRQAARRQEGRIRLVRSDQAAPEGSQALAALQDRAQALLAHAGVECNQPPTIMTAGDTPIVMSVEAGQGEEQPSLLATPQLCEVTPPGEAVERPVGMPADGVKVPA